MGVMLEPPQPNTPTSPRRRHCARRLIDGVWHLAVRDARSRLSRRLTALPHDADRDEERARQPDPSYFTPQHGEAAVGHECLEPDRGHPNRPDRKEVASVA